MSAVLVKLKQVGQIKSDELAQLCGMTERDINKALYPHVAAGRVMSCTVYQGSKRVGMEYRLSGTVPRVRPGPKVAAAKNNTAHKE
jgi:hypothetical protein